MRLAVDQCPNCGSFDATAWYKDGRRYDAWARNAPLWDEFKCQECGTKWKFTFIEGISAQV